MDVDDGFPERSVRQGRDLAGDAPVQRKWTRCLVTEHGEPGTNSWRRA
jgi:hypothetical protein